MHKTKTRKGGNHLAKRTGFVGAYIDQGTFDALREIAREERLACGSRPVCRQCKTCLAVKELMGRVLSTVRFLTKGGNHPRHK